MIYATQISMIRIALLFLALGQHSLVECLDTGLLLAGNDAQLHLGPPDAGCTIKFNEGPPPYLESSCPINAPPPAPAPSPPTGGNVTEGPDFRMHVFSSSGSFSSPTGLTLSNLLLVGGGGGCAYFQHHAGGGGAGGLVNASEFDIAAGDYNIVIGAGGTGSSSRQTTGTSGESTTAFGLIAQGGGYPSGDGLNHDDQFHLAADGGSGGGCQLYHGQYGNCVETRSTQAKYADMPNVNGYGHGGGFGGGRGYGVGGCNECPTCVGTADEGGGGGGAGGPGGHCGNGGPGLDFSDVFGTSFGDDGWFAGGGGGAGKCCGALDTTQGGKGGGGDGSSTDGEDGMPNTGGGCGASERGALQHAGYSGGSGIVIIKYAI